MSKVALCVIAKNEEGKIGSMMNSIDGYVDHVFLLDTGSTDNTVEEAKGALNNTPITVKIETIEQEQLPGVFNFAEARHINFQMAKGFDWIVWLDCDDSLMGAEKLKDTIKTLEDRGLNGCWTTYNYDYDVQGNPVLQHKRRFLIKADEWEWEPHYLRDRGIRYPIHENLYCLTDEKMGVTQEIYIDHHKTQEGHDRSANRNLEILHRLIKFEGDNRDPRTTFLMGRQMFDHYRKDANEKITQATVNYLLEYINGSYADHDHLESCKMLSEVYRNVGDWEKQRRIALEAIAVNPQKPDGYVLYADVLRNEGRFEDALIQIEIAKSKPYTGLEVEGVNERGLFRDMAFIAAESHAGLEEYDAACEWLEAYLQDPDAVYYEAVVKEYTKYKAKAKLDRIVKGIVEGYAHLKNKQNIVDIMHYYPKYFSNHKQIQRLFKSLPDRNKRDKYSVDFYCAANFEQWDYKTVQENGGGGSETAIVELSHWFAKQGYKVTVWNKPPQEREIDGVWYRDLDGIDFSTDFDIFISWRNPNIFAEFDIDANKKFLFLQDIMQPFDYPRNVWEQLDKIIVLSKYHAGWLPFVPKDKFYFTTNGINLDLIKEVEAEGIKRDKNKVLYCSSSDRGLEGLIFDIWPEVLKEVPDAELYYYYGWNSFDVLSGTKEEELSEHAKGRLEWKKQMQGQMKKMGIKDMGRVSKKELYRAMFGAGTLAYPLVGPAETSCIVLMEAQATGMLPITTGITALEETQQYGIKEPNLAAYKHKLITALKNDPTTYPNEEQMAWARDKFDWEKIAGQWVSDLFYGRNN